MHVQSLGHVQLFVTLWTVDHTAPLSMGFSRQEHWSGLPSPPPGDLADSEVEPESLVSPALQVDSLLLSHRGCLDICLKVKVKVKSLSRVRLLRPCGL